MAPIQICNTSQERIKLPARTYNMLGWVIPECPKDKPFTSIVIEDFTDIRKVYTTYAENEAEKIPVPVPADVIIRDLFAHEKLKERGCFTLPAGEIPTAAQIIEAKRNRTTYLQYLVEVGDKEYSRTKKVDEIPDFCKRAVDELNLKREWAVVTPAAMEECPACAEHVKVGVAICKSCGAILNREKAAQFGLIQGEALPVQVSAKRGPGRPKKEEKAETDALYDGE